MKVFSFFLPQFHPIPQNDEWWGAGFTEWTNVARSVPKFRGHYQPHLPADLGFYDLRLADTRHQQADLARQYGIDGFIYYHYWFNGTRLLHEPLDFLLTEQAPGFPYFFCWANENWTRRWDGMEANILIKQDYSFADDLEHIRFLIPFFKTEAYHKRLGCPVLAVYRTELLPDPAETVRIWREEVKKAGFPDLFLIRIENLGPRPDPASEGFDAALEFAPDQVIRGPRLYHGRRYEWLSAMGLLEKGKVENRLYRYDSLVRAMLNKRKPGYRWYRCACPSWDNSARRQQGASLFLDPDPALFREWVTTLLRDSLSQQPEEDQFIAINAWNEWAEGCHLEPDQRYGHAWLEAVRDAKRDAGCL